MEIMTTTDLSGGNGSFWEDELYKSLKIVSLIIFSLVFVLGVLGNGVVIWVTGFKMKKTINTVWYLNLAVADFLVTAFLPLIITETALDDLWPFDHFMCKLNFTVLFLNMYASVYILMGISVDRCVCVVWPVWNHCSVRQASCVSLGVWVLALALSSPYFIFMEGPSFLHNIECFEYFTLSQFGIIFLTQFFMGFMFPLTVMVFCYSVIRRNRSLASHSGRPFKITAAIITAFVMRWAPFHIMELIVLVNILVGYHSKTVDNMYIIGFPIAFCLASLNSCLKPLLYMFMGQGFKDEVRKLSILRVLEKAFTEELPKTNTSTNPGITSKDKSFY